MFASPITNLFPAPFQPLYAKSQRNAWSLSTYGPRILRSPFPPLVFLSSVSCISLFLFEISPAAPLREMDRQAIALPMPRYMSNQIPLFAARPQSRGYSSFPYFRLLSLSGRVRMSVELSPLSLFPVIFGKHVQTFSNSSISNTVTAP